MLAGNSSLPVSDGSSGGGNATVILPLIQRPAAWGVLEPRKRRSIVVIDSLEHLAAELALEKFLS